MGAFICQISESDWLISREIGVYGNREGSERSGEIVYFADMKKGIGEQIIQSIIEDLLGMRKGDTVFFHVIGAAEGESSIHGIYSVREEPFYNDDVKLWRSSPYLTYPYRFCFEPHAEHIELCKYDASILVSEFYKSVENRNICSVLTLEREVRGSAHAVKKISSDDTEEILKLLYRDFNSRCFKDSIDFKPVSMKGPSLRNHIRGVGKIEFAIKALVAYELGQRESNLVKWIPACRNSEYDFLIESFVGQTARKPTDILCISSGGLEKAVTVVEAKTDLVQMDDLIQSLKYQELFKLRNIDKGSLTYKMSICLLGQRFHQELINYTPIRNMVLPWEEIILLKYNPTQDGKNATFTPEKLTKGVLPIMPKIYPEINIHHLLSQISSSPNGLYPILGKKSPPKTNIELKCSKENIHILRKYYNCNGQGLLLGHILICEIHKTCVLEDLGKFISNIYEEANKFQGNLMAIDPIIVAENYDDSVKFFIDQYNTYETRAGREAISAYMLSKN
jgi:hypothetical protein